MPKLEPYKPESNDDPPAAFPSDAEIEIADQLRHRLEERYLPRPETSPPLPAPSGNGRRLDR